MFTNSIEYQPSPFESLEPFMEIGGQLVESITLEKKSISLPNITVVLTLAICSLGLSMSFTSKEWWLKRSCKIRPLNIKLQAITPAFYISGAKTTASLLNKLEHRKLKKFCTRFTKHGWALPDQLPLYSPQATEALSLTFIEYIRGRNWEEIEQTALQFKPNLVLIEQMALNALEPDKEAQRHRADFKLEKAAELHGLRLSDQWSLQSADEIASSIRNHQAIEPQTLSPKAFFDGFYCLLGHTPGDSDHHLLIFFQRQGHYYLFNPYQGLLKLEKDPKFQPEELFGAYSQVQLHEKEVSKLSISYLEYHRSTALTKKN